MLDHNHLSLCVKAPGHFKQSFRGKKRNLARLNTRRFMLFWCSLCLFLFLLLSQVSWLVVPAVRLLQQHVKTPHLLNKLRIFSSVLHPISWCQLLSPLPLVTDDLWLFYFLNGVSDVFTGLYFHFIILCFLKYTGAFNCSKTVTLQWCKCWAVALPVMKEQLALCCQ